MRPQTLTPQQSVGKEHPASLGLGYAGDAPGLRDTGLARARFYLGLVGLFVSYVALSLAAWAVVPSMVPGWQSVVITSGSMAPVIKTGDVVVAKPSDGQGLAPGAVIVISDPALPGLTTHRIVDVNADGSYRTRGDANTGPDSTPVSPEHVIAVGRLVVPRAALPLVWYSKGEWLNMAVLGIFMVSSLWVARYAYPRPPLEGVQRPSGQAQE